MRRHRRVGGLQGAVESEPRGLAGRTAELVQLLPALAQLLDRIGTRLELNFFPGGPGEPLRFGDQLLAPLSAAPALPFAQAQLFLAQGFDAPGERGIHRSGFERAVDLRDQPRQLRDLSRGMRRFGLLHMALHLSQAPFPSLGAELPFVRSARFALASALFAASIAPLGKAMREQSLQFAVRDLRKAAPLLDLRLFLGFVRKAGNGQRAQELGALHDARGERQRAIGSIDFLGAARITGRAGGAGRLVQQLQQGCRLLGCRAGRLRRCRRHRVGRHAGEPRRQGVDHGIRGGEPACERLSGLAAFAQLRAELRAHRRELARQRLVGQGFAQRRPGTVQLDQAIDRNALLLEQAVRSGDQDRGLREGFAPGDRRLQARLRRAIQSLILIPKFARRLL